MVNIWKYLIEPGNHSNKKRTVKLFKKQYTSIIIKINECMVKYCNLSLISPSRNLSLSRNKETLSRLALNLFRKAMKLVAVFIQEEQI